MNSKINLNEISDFLSNLRKNNDTLHESTIAPIVAESVLRKPYPDSDLHSLTFEELSTKLNEARREQHRIPQFSEQEIAHLKFVDEAMSILEYVQSAGNTFVSSIQKSKEAHDKGDAESAQAHFKTAKKSRYHMNDKDLDQATPHFKVYKELQKKYDDKPNVAESEKLEELSNETLGRYKSAKLNESRREQYRIPQFSKQEADRLNFVNEGVEMADTPVAKYVADNLKAWKKGGGSIDLAVDRKNVRVQHGPVKTPSAVSLTLQPNGKWKIEMLVRFKSSHAAGEKISGEAAVDLLKSFVDHCQSVGLGESEELDELSTALLGKYKSAAGKAASAADAAGDFKTGNKRFSGIMKATKKQFANDAKKVKTESEELDEFVEYKNLTTHAAMHKQKQSNLASGVEHLAKKNTAMMAHHAAKKAGNHEEAAKHLETANAHHATAMKHHDAVQELSKKMAALHTN